MYKKIIRNTLIMTALLGASSYSFTSCEGVSKSEMSISEITECRDLNRSNQWEPTNYKKPSPACVAYLKDKGLYADRALAIADRGRMIEMIR